MITETIRETELGSKVTKHIQAIWSYYDAFDAQIHQPFWTNGDLME